MRMPPNQEEVRQAAGVDLASMEGGMRMPPNDAHEHPNGGRHAHACRITVDAPHRPPASMEGGMRMPPNLQDQGAATVAHAHASMEGGMRMPPNRPWLAPVHGVDCFNGGRHAHAAECRRPGSHTMLQWRAACACRRMSGRRTELRTPTPLTLQWRAACACRRIGQCPTWSSPRPAPSMEGGMRMPPNRHHREAKRSSCSAFNGGRHAHAAESPHRAPSARSAAAFNGGRHAHAAESGWPAPRRLR